MLLHLLLAGHVGDDDDRWASADLLSFVAAELHLGDRVLRHRVASDGFVMLQLQQLPAGDDFLCSMRRNRAHDRLRVRCRLCRIRELTGERVRSAGRRRLARKQRM